MQAVLWFKLLNHTFLIVLEVNYKISKKKSKHTYLCICCHKKIGNLTSEKLFAIKIQVAWECPQQILAINCVDIQYRKDNNKNRNFFALHAEDTSMSNFSAMRVYTGMIC